jgi:hypothetical protein
MKAVARRRAHDPLDELYAVPLRDFIARRNGIVARLREAGRDADAKALAAIAKPKATVWAINRVARASPKLVARALTAFDALKAAQLRTPAKMGEAAAAFRAATEAVVHEAIAAMKEAGLSTTLDTHRRLANTLRGAATSARGPLTDGRLTDEVAPAGFELFAGTTPRGRRLRATRATPERAPTSPTPAPARRNDDLAHRRAAQLEAEAGSREWDAKQASAAVRQAREHLRALEKAARTAARAASKTRTLARRARTRTAR